MLSGNPFATTAATVSSLHTYRRTKMTFRVNQILKPSLIAATLLCTAAPVLAQNRAVGFTKGMPFSDGFVSGNTLYVAGQQGPDINGKVAGLDITAQTTNAIAAINKVVEEAGLKMGDIVSVTIYVAHVKDVPAMNKVYEKLMPDPKPARATVQVAGLIGGAKIEISAVAVKQKPDL
jgi:2-iminobutanoate/2-iminopropanoate deaminase